MSRRVCALLALAAATAAQSSDGWTTDHHDQRNSGFAAALGSPASAAAACRKNIYDAPVKGERFQGTGVTSLDGSVYYVADNKNNLHVVDVATLKGKRVNLTALTPPPRTVNGVISSPALAPLRIGADAVDRLFIASTDKVLYAVNAQACVAAAEAGRLELEGAHLVESSTQPGLRHVDRAAWAAAAGVASEEATPCLQFSITTRKPLFAAPRWTLLPSRFETGVVYAMESDERDNAYGQVMAYDAANGTLLWTHDMIWNSSWYGARATPALAMNGDQVMYIAYGPRLIAVNPATGDKLASVTNTAAADADGRPGDHFVSPPVVTAAGDAVFLHSSVGTLWRVDVTGSAAGGNLALTLAWGCDYNAPGGAAGLPSCYGPTDPGFAAARAARLQAAAAEAAAAVASAAAAVQAAAPGSAARRAAARALFSTASTSGSLASPASTSGVGIDPGLLPLSTPALAANDSLIVLAQYSLVGNQGVFGVNPKTGMQVWSFFSTTDLNGSPIIFDRSRSSPAIDAGGNILVGAEAVAGPFSYPVLFALNATGSFVWAMRVGSAGEYVGHGSPVIAPPPTGVSARAYMVSDRYVAAVDPSVGCPSSTLLQACSGLGACDCATGKCSCNSCSSGPGCANDNCGPHGTCSPGGCLCEPCWTGPACDTPLACYNNGTCNPATGTCSCPGCFTGAHCEGVCNGVGSCGAGNVCTCSNPNCYTGIKCGIECGGMGTCNAGGSCACQLPCQSGPICDICNGAGICNAGACTCTNQCYSGPGCTVQKACPTNTVCVPTTGNCLCPPLGCFTGPACNETRTCGVNGVCFPGAGCTCAAGFGPGGAGGCDTPCNVCQEGPNCATNKTCNGHGTCTVAGGVGCVCEAGWTGPACATRVGPSGPGESGGGGGGVAAGVLIPLSLVGAVAGFYYYKKRRDPSYRLADMVPSRVKRLLRIGPNYEPLWLASGATSASAGAGAGGGGAAIGSSGGSGYGSASVSASSGARTGGLSRGFQNSYGSI